MQGCQAGPGLVRRHRRLGDSDGLVDEATANTHASVQILIAVRRMEVRATAATEVGSMSSTARALCRVPLIACALCAAMDARALQCATATPIEFDGTGFAANAPLERLEVRSGRPGAADWKWGLGTNTQLTGSFVSSTSPNWVSGQALNWRLTIDSSGSGTIVVSNGTTPVFSRTFVSSPPGLRNGNAVRAYVKATADAGTATIAATVTSVNGKPVALSLVTPGTSQFAELSRYLYYPEMRAALALEGTVRLTFSGASPPNGSRLNFLVTAGNVPCESAGAPPNITQPSPSAGAVLAADELPQIAASFATDRAPIDPGSVRISVDNVDVTAAAVITAGGIAYGPTAALTEGAHQVTISVADTAATPASLTWQFTTRSAPEIPDATPQIIATTNPRPRILARFTDVGSGIDPTSVQLTLNGADVTPLATITSSAAWFIPTNPLTPGVQNVAAIVKDRAGNAATRTWTFRVIELSPPVPEGGDRVSPLELLPMQLQPIEPAP